MFQERALFYPEHVLMQQACMSRYLSILRRNIQEFMENSSYRTFAKLQENVRWREIELETQAWEDVESQGRDRRPAQSQPVAKRAKPADSRTGG